MSPKCNEYTIKEFIKEWGNRTRNNILDHSVCYNVISVETASLNDAIADGKNWIKRREKLLQEPLFKPLIHTVIDNEKSSQI